MGEGTSMWLQLLTQIASTGLVGVFLVLAVHALYKKDKELQTEKNSRIEDSQKYMTLAMSLQKDVITAVRTLGEIVEKWEKREEARDRLELEIQRRLRIGASDQP